MHSLSTLRTRATIGDSDASRSRTNSMDRIGHKMLNNARHQMDSKLQDAAEEKANKIKSAEASANSANLLAADTWTDRCQMFVLEVFSVFIILFAVPVILIYMWKKQITGNIRFTVAT